MANEATVYGQRIPTSKGNEDDPRTGADGSISVDPNLAEKIKGENLTQRLHRLSIQEKDIHTQAYIVQPKMEPHTGSTHQPLAFQSMGPHEKLEIVTTDDQAQETPSPASQDHTVLFLQHSV